METKLVVVGGKANRQEIRLKLPATLGRGRDADLTVAHPLISRHHCRLEEVDGALVLRDNNSTNGTFVGKTRITQVVLKPGDQFTVGPLTFKAVYQHTGAFPKIGKPGVNDDDSETLGLPPSAGADSSVSDFTVAFDSEEATKAKSPAKPAPAKGGSKTKSTPAETKPTAKPAEKKPAAKQADKQPAAKPVDKKPAAKQEDKKAAVPAKPKSAPAKPPAAAVPSASDVDVMDWLAEPGATARIAEPEPLADLGFDDEPMAASAAPEAPPADEFDALPAAVEEGAEVSDWLDQPAAESAPADPLADVGFEDEPIAAAAPPKVSPADEFDALPPVAEEEAEVMDWLEEPAVPAAPPADPLADVGFEDEPVAAAAPPEVSPADEFDALPPVAEEEAEVMDWLEEPAVPAAPPADPLADVGFDDAPIAAAAPPEVVSADEVDLLPPTPPTEEAEVLDWLEEPAVPAAAPVDTLGDISFDDEPVAAAASEAPPAEEFDALPPAADEEAEVLDWLEEPAVPAAAPAEPLADIVFNDEPIAAAAPPEAAPADQIDALSPTPPGEEAEVLDWLEEPAIPAAAPAEPVAEFGFNDEPIAAAPLELVPADELDSLPPEVEEEAEVMDWLEEPAATAAPADPLADIGFDDAPIAAALPDTALAGGIAALPPVAEDEEAEVLDWLEEPAAPAGPVADLGIEEEPRAAANAEQLVQPTADEEDDVFGWLDEPPAGAPPAESGLMGDVEFGELPVAAAPVKEDAPPAAEADDDLMNWLGEPAASSPPVEAEPLGDVEFGELPVAAEPIDEDAAPAEPAAFVPPAAAAEADDDFMNWLEEPEPQAALSEVESPASLSFDEEPPATLPLADLGTPEEPVAAEALPEIDDEITLPAGAASDDDFVDWLGEPAASAPSVEAEPLGDVEFGESPVAAEPIEEDAAPVEPAAFVPPAAAAEADDDFMNWLEESVPQAALSEVESSEVLSFDEEPTATLPLADLGAPEEPVAAAALPEIDDEITLPAAEADDDFVDWLGEPAASAPPAEAEPLGDVEFGELPVAAEPIDEDAAPVEPAAFAPPAAAAEADDDFMNWLEEPEPQAALSEVESSESLSFDEEPVPAVPLADIGAPEEPVAAEALPEIDDEITLPAAAAKDDFVDWLGEPAASAPPVEAEPLGDVEFGELPVAAEPIEEDAAPVDPAAFAPPAAAAEADDDFMNWLEEPEPQAALSEVESSESLSFDDEEPVPAMPLADIGAPEEPVAALPLSEETDKITLPAAAASDDDFVDWLGEPAPRAAHSEVESPESMSFDEEPVPAEALPGAAFVDESAAEDPEAEESDLIASPSADAKAGVLDWLGEPAVGESPTEAEPLVDFGLDEEPVAAEPFDAESELPESEPIAPPSVEAGEMTAFWPGGTPQADPQLEEQALDELDFDFGSEPEADAALGGLPEPIEESMFADEDATNAAPAIPDEAADLELNLGAEPDDSDPDATEMFLASDATEQMPVKAKPADLSDDDAFGSLGGPDGGFESAEIKSEDEPVEFDFLAGDDAPVPAVTDEFQIQPEVPRSLPPITLRGADRSESAAEKPAKKGWWPFGKSKKDSPKKEKPEKPKKAKPEPKGRKSAAKAPEPEPEEMPMPAAEAVHLEPPEEFIAPAVPQAEADAEGMPDFSFADSGNDAPAKSGGDDDLDDFFQDLDLK